jgi:hypothetical protein
MVRLLPGDLREFELFSRVFPIEVQTADRSRTYFIWAPTGSLKEDWFIALLYASFGAKMPRSSDVLISLGVYDYAKRFVGHRLETPWLGLIIDRTSSNPASRKRIGENVTAMFNHKLSRADQSSLIKNVKVVKVEVEGLPNISNITVLDCNRNGHLLLDFDLSFESVFKLTLTADFTVDNMLVAFTVPLQLVARLSRIHGKAQALVKPPPSGRFWVGFHPPGPEFELDVEPNISHTSVRLSLVTELLRFQFQSVLRSDFVLPNRDDISFTGTSALDSSEITVIPGEFVGTPSTITKGHVPPNQKLPEPVISTQVLKSEAPYTTTNKDAECLRKRK